MGNWQSKIEFNEQSRDLDALIALPRSGFGSNGSAWAVILIHPRSGMPVIWCTSRKISVYVGEKNDWIQLNYEEMRVLHQEETLIRFGKATFRFVLSNHDDGKYESMMFDRNYAILQAGQAMPDQRLYALPRNRPFPMIGSVLIHNTMGMNDFVWNYLGVEITTGEPIMVQEHSATKDNPRSGIIHEGCLLLTFPVS